jgi:hypothetical protein
MLLIFVSLNRRVLLARLPGKYEERPAGGQVAAARAVSIETLLLLALRNTGSSAAAGDDDCE